MFIKPRNWTQFQHYRDRCPPWIKLHKSLLDDSNFHRLPDASRALAPCLWLLASEHKDGLIDASAAELSFRLRRTERWTQEALKPLIDNGFFLVEHDASMTLAPRLQDACLEESREETEREREKIPAAPDLSITIKRKRKTPLPDGFSVSQGVADWATAKGYGRLHEHLEAFKAKALARSYEYADWDAAFREAIREDWAHLRGGNGFGSNGNGAAPPPDVNRTGKELEEIKRHAEKLATPEARSQVEEARKLAMSAVRRAG